MTTPVAPDLPDVSTFGGFMTNADPVVDPTSELDSSFWNRIIAQLTAMSGPIPKAVVFVNNPSGVPAVSSFLSVWGSGPAGLPTVAAVAGVYTLTFPTTVQDLQQTPETHTLNIRGGIAWPIDPNFYTGSVGVVTANTLTCAFFSPSGGATKYAPGRFVVAVW